MTTSPDKPMIQSTEELDREHGHRTQNVRIAEAMGFVEVFGKDRDNDYNEREWKKPGVTTPEGWDGHYEHALPDYFNDANAALTICEFMRGKGMTQFRADWYEAADGDPAVWRCIFYFRGEDPIMGPDCPTIAQAICRAFIAFLDSREDGK
jgi:hypothetical protein